MDHRKLIKIWMPDSHQKGFQEGFKISPRAAQKLGPQQLTDIIERFRRTGSVSPEKGLKTRQKRVCTAKNVVKVRNHFVETPKASLRKSSHVLGIKKTSQRNFEKRFENEAIQTVPLSRVNGRTTTKSNGMTSADGSSTMELIPTKSFLLMKSGFAWVDRQSSQKRPSFAIRNE